MRTTTSIIFLAILAAIVLTGAGAYSDEPGGDCIGCHQLETESSGRHFIEVSDDCLFCHTPLDKNGVHRVATTESNDLCLACHADHDSMDKGNDHDQLFCTDCHDPHGSTHESNLKTQVVQLCSENCHGFDQLGNSHSVGATIVDSRTGGALTCVSTCHSMHQPVGQKHLLQASKDELCGSCHGDKV